MRPAQVASALRTRLAPVVEQEGYDLEDLVVTPAGKRRLVRLTVDRDGGVSLDQCADVSRAVSAALDTADDLLGPQPYVLEVSSPGVSRPLRLPRHWRRNLGRLVRVTRQDGSTVTGRLSTCDDDEAVLALEGDEVRLRLDQVASAVVQVEMRPGQPPGPEERPDEQRRED